MSTKRKWPQSKLVKIKWLSSDNSKGHIKVKWPHTMDIPEISAKISLARKNLRKRSNWNSAYIWIDSCIDEVRRCLQLRKRARG